jgi:hypothetical protein
MARELAVRDFSTEFHDNSKALSVHISVGKDTTGNLLLHHYVPNSEIALSSVNETYSHLQA